MIPAPLWCGCPSFLPHGDHLGQTGTGHETLRMAATVLIVDDHPGFRAAARRLLELEGYVVVGEAADGETAIDAGGGFRVPLVYGALLRSRPFDDVVLHDVDAARLDRIADVLEGQAAEHGERLPFRASTDLDDALEGADFVFVAIRVGGLEGRTIDEAVPLGHGVLGQETIGAGGICCALRTSPAMVDLPEGTASRAAGDTPEQALARWRAAKDERDRTYMAEARNGHEGTSHGEDEPGGYEAEALAVVEAIAHDAGAVRILNVANRSALPFLDERAVVEVPCVIGASGVRPLAVGPVPDHARALIDTVKAVERTTIEAALTGSTALAVKALALHPLVPSVTAARAIFAGYRERLPELEERFA